MEQKIYPLNVGQGDENKSLTPKTPKKPKGGKKPSFGQWLKAKKWIVGAVAAVVVIGGGVGAWYMGLGEFLKGFQGTPGQGGLPDLPGQDIPLLPGDIPNPWPVLEEFYFGEEGDVNKPITLTVNKNEVDSVKTYFKLSNGLQGGTLHLAITGPLEGGIDGTAEDLYFNSIEDTFIWDMKYEDTGNDILEGTYTFLLKYATSPTEFKTYNTQEILLTITDESVLDLDSVTLTSFTRTPTKIEEEDESVTISYIVDHGGYNGLLFKTIYITTKDNTIANSVNNSYLNEPLQTASGSYVWDGECNVAEKCTADEIVTNGDYDIYLEIKDPLTGNTKLFTDNSEVLGVEVAIADPVSVPEICDNGVDDDLDGLIDLNDLIDCPSQTTQPECNNTTDDDGDGNIDWPNDEGCFGPEDTTENSEGTTPDEICDNEVDDDGDGKTDYDDSECDIPDDADIDVYDDGASRTKFNPEINSVKLFYKLSEDGHVTVEIIDSDDEVVVELLDEDQEKKDGVSHHTLWWNGTKTNKNSGQIVPDGTYTYKITATHADYPTLEDTEEGPLTITSDYVDGVGDFENPDGGGDVQPGGGGTGGDTPDQDDATIAMQNAQGGTTAGTGPGVLIYFLFPFIPYAFRRIKS